jgi:hypothetical protein
VFLPLSVLCSLESEFHMPSALGSVGHPTQTRPFVGGFRDEATSLYSCETVDERDITLSK